MEAVSCSGQVPLTTLALDASKTSLSYLGRFTPGEITPVSLG